MEYENPHLFSQLGTLKYLESLQLAIDFPGV